VTLTAVMPGLTGKGVYQWTKDGAPIPDATANAYHIASLIEADAGWYGCQITPAQEVFTPQPVPILVFPEGSLPAAGYLGIGLAAFAALALGLAALHRRLLALKSIHR
jgi:hypothetical protein